MLPLHPARLHNSIDESAPGNTPKGVRKFKKLRLFGSAWQRHHFGWRSKSVEYYQWLDKRPLGVLEGPSNQNINMVWAPWYGVCLVQRPAGLVASVSSPLLRRIRKHPISVIRDFTEGTLPLFGRRQLDRAGMAKQWLVAKGATKHRVLLNASLTWVESVEGQ